MGRQGYGARAMRFAPALVLSLLSVAAAVADEGFDPDRLEREVLVPATDDPTALDVADDGAVYFISRPGALRKWNPTDRSVKGLGTIASLPRSDAGALGFVLDRDFARSGHFFLLYVPDRQPPALRVSRFSLREDTVQEGSEKILLAMPLEGGNAPPHCGGGLAWTPEGHLLVGTGDNSPPQDVPATHPDERARDSRRSAANSRDWRGKILRLTPTPDGGYTIPPGNLFADAKDGLPEIFAMGVRNPYRITTDPATGWIIWGDVGGNVDPALDLGPEGFDELNLTTEPGFFGWPYCSGPNLPWRPFAGDTNRPAGDFYDPQRLVNDSPANTGIKELPPARPALLWYGTSASAEWPQLGSGGRSVTGGPVYRYDETSSSPVKLPREFDGAIIWGEWMRNYLALARLSPSGTLSGVELFMPGTSFRKPSDLRIGPDGALYVAEYGDAWGGNANGQITRVVYRRGNRPPRAVARASVSAGPVPLRVTFEAAGSDDSDAADRDALRYHWTFGDGAAATGATAEHVFATEGRWPVELAVRDPRGAEARTTVVVTAGNTAPVLRFLAPRDGGFFEPGAEVDFRVEATDAEDGLLPAEKVAVQLERRERLREEDDAARFPGLVTMRAGTCFACHRTGEASAGPAYVEIARRYAAEPDAREQLAQKILRGGAGRWGEIPMPPHPQHTLAQAREMVEWIESLAARDTRRLPGGPEGSFTIEPPRDGGRGAGEVVVLTAGATDAGTALCPPLSGETSLVLRSRGQRAAAFDRGAQAAVQHNLDDNLVARVQAGGWISFDHISLAAFQTIRLRCRPIAGSELRLELRHGSPEGPLLAHASLPDPSPSQRRPHEVVMAPESAGPGNTDVSIDLYFRLHGPDAVCDMISLEFR